MAVPNPAGRATIDPGETDVLGLDWGAQRLHAGETIDTSVWTVAPADGGVGTGGPAFGDGGAGGVIVAGTGGAARGTAFTVDGGAATMGRFWDFTNAITTTEGRELQATINVRIRDH